MGANTLVSRPRPIRVTWRFLSRDHLIPKSHFLVYVLYCNWVSISNHFRDNGHFYIWVTTLTFLGHVTSSVTWPIDPPYVISYWCPIVTEPLSLTVFEIFGPTRTHTHTQTRRKWLYILSHAMYCIGQTITYFTMNVSIITERVSIWPK